jgi:threonine dehydratase
VIPLIAWQQYVEQASAVIAGALDPTPVIASPCLGNEINLKLETLQPTGSFKVRGALAALSSHEHVDGDFVIASTGNFALGMAWAASFLGRSVTVVVPEITSSAKLSALSNFSINLVVHGDSKEAAELYARSLARDDLHYLGAATEPTVIAGQATVGTELLNQLDGAFTVVCGIGSGGLASGLGIVARNSGRLEVVGVEAERSPAMSTALRAGSILPITVRSTLADGLAGNLASDSITVDLIKSYVKTIVTVTETEIAESIRYLVREHGVVTEGAGAAPVAAIMAGKMPAAGSTTAVLTGRNIAWETLTDILRESL